MLSCKIAEGLGNFEAVKIATFHLLEIRVR